jgi:hypothetical protein
MGRRAAIRIEEGSARQLEVACRCIVYCVWWKFRVFMTRPESSSDASIPRDHVPLPVLQQILRHVPQHKLPDLATPCQRYLIGTILAEPKHMHRCLVSAQYFPYPTPDLIQRYLVRAFLAEQERGRDFDVARMRYADDDCASDGRVLDETFFDFEGVDILSA